MTTTGMETLAGETVLDQTLSKQLNERLHHVIPGGAHTYAKGDDQWPEGLAPVIARGKGAHVWDVDGNEYIEYGSGLRAVSLGHAHPRVLEAVRRQLDLGSNFVRPSSIELEAAERFLATVPTAEMVKFAKNGSDATTAAVRLARAATRRPLVAICRDHPFFSTDDWFIGTTPMSAGIPNQVRDLTVTFPYGDLGATEQMLQQSNGEVACLVLEAARDDDPPPGYLQGLVDLAHRHGALVVFDEMITGFRWSPAGAQGLYGVTPDLSTFGKALGNGFAVSALAGRREFMERGGLRTDEDRVFLLSTTHGAEAGALAAAIAVMDEYKDSGISQTLHDTGARLRTSVQGVIGSHGLEDYLRVTGRDSNLVFATFGPGGQPSQQFRTLFLMLLLQHGVLAPSFVVSSAVSDDDVETVVRAVEAACGPYKEALQDGTPQRWIGSDTVKPVFRRRA